MARSTIDTFKSSVITDFARPNLFQVDIDFPAVLAGVGDDVKKLGAFLVKAANLPASQLGVVEVPFRGRTLKIAGDRTFEAWTITVFNDTNFVLRNSFESWVEAIQANNENYSTIAGLGSSSGTTGATGTSNVNSGYFKNMSVTQLDRQGNAKATYQFINVFPTNVSAIDLDFGSNDAIEEFTVELQVQYWNKVGTPSTNNNLQV